MKPKPVSFITAYFLAAVFRHELDDARPLLVSFEGDPANVPSTAWSKRPWTGTRDDAINCAAGANNYFTLATFRSDDAGRYRLQKPRFHALYAVMLDDVGTKVVMEPPPLQPSWLLETSPGNHQAGYLLSEPLSNGAAVDRLMNAIIEAGLCGPGANGPRSRLAWLPCASNGKHAPPFPCRLIEWLPGLRYSIDELLDGLELETSRARRPRGRGSRPVRQRPTDGDPVCIAHPEENALLAALRDRGAHFVLARPDKRPITRGWLNSAPSYEAVLSHVRKGGRLGVVASSLGCVVVDIDKGHPSTVINVLGSPLCIVETPRGHHLWYRAPSGEIGNRTWAVNGAHGDIRGSKGSIILWDVAAVAAGLSRVDDAVPVDLSKILRPPSKRTQRGPDAVRAAKPGERNLTLNREVFKAARAGNFDREAFQEAGVEAGLPLAAVVATIASAEQAGTNAASSKLDINQLGAIIRDEDTGRWAYTAGRGWYRRSEGGLWRRDPQALALRGRFQELIDIGIAQRGTRARLAVETVEPAFAVDPGRWDAEPHLVGLPSGRVFDLRTGQAVDGGDVFITRRLGVVPEDGEPTRWLRFLAETFSLTGEPDRVVAWLRWWLRIALSGDCRHESLVFLFGPRGTGKSTIAETWQYVVGEYGATVPGERLTSDRGTHRQWIANLAGVRHVFVNELPERGRWQTPDLNALVSGESITANFMHQGDFTFRSQAHVIVVANHRPRVSAQSGFWRRLRLVECRHVPNSPDDGLKERLRGEAGRILQWVLDGPEAQPKKPVGMDANARTYMEEADHLAAWLNECVEIDGNAFETAEALRSSYEAWSNREGIDPPMRPRTLGMKLTERFGAGFDKKVSGRTVKCRAGVRLRKVAVADGRG